MQFPGGLNAVSRSDIWRLELMSEEKGTFKGNGKIFELNFILSQIFLAEWTLSLITNLVKLRVLDHHLKCYKKKNMGEGRGNNKNNDENSCR